MPCQYIGVFLTWAGGRGPALCTAGLSFSCYTDLVMAGSKGSTEKSPYMPVREARPGSPCAKREPLENTPFSEADTWVQAVTGRLDQHRPAAGEPGRWTRGQPTVTLICRSHTIRPTFSTCSELPINIQCNLQLSDAGTSLQPPAIALALPTLPALCWLWSHAAFHLGAVSPNKASLPRANKEIDPLPLVNRVPRECCRPGGHRSTHLSIRSPTNLCL